MEKILNKLKLLRREETEYYNKASVAEAIDVLIEAVEFLFNNQPERLNPKGGKATCDSLNSAVTQRENTEE